jgi:hypothetical protein
MAHRIHLAAFFALGATVLGVPKIASATVRMDSSEHQALADEGFHTYLVETFPDAEISASPYCTVTIEDDDEYPLATATCEALVDGEHVAYVGEFNDYDGGDYIGWETVEEAVAEEQAEVQFPTWVTETYDVELSADGHASCQVMRPDNDDPWMSCEGNLADGRSIEATAPLPSDGASFEFVTEFRDGPEFDTLIADAVHACGVDVEPDWETTVTDEEGNSVDEDGNVILFDEATFEDYTVMDTGHSVEVGGDLEESFSCLAEQLGLPEWLVAQVDDSYDVPVWTAVTVGGYTARWLDDYVIVYDDEVA